MFLQIEHSSLSARKKHRSHSEIPSTAFLRVSESDAAKTRSLFTRWYARREAVFSPIEGSRESSAINFCNAGGKEITLEQTRHIHPTRGLRHLLLELLLHLPQRLVGGSDYQVLEHLDIVWIYYLAIKGNRE